VAVARIDVGVAAHQPADQVAGRSGDGDRGQRALPHRVGDGVGLVLDGLAGAADQVSDYASRARETIEDQADALSETVRERPLVAVAVAAIGGYLIGRLMGGNTYVYRDR